MSQASRTNTALVTRALAVTRICGCIGMGQKLREMTIRLACMAGFYLESATRRRMKVSTAFAQVVLAANLVAW